VSLKAEIAQSSIDAIAIRLASGREVEPRN
jgi:hypothetical protein